MKICTVCSILKSLEDFHRYTPSKDGRKPSCKKCPSDAEKIRYINDNKRIIENVKKYAVENRELVLESKRQYRRDNKDILAEKKWIYIQEKIQTDPVFKIKRALRKRLAAAITRKYAKAGSHIKELGCTVPELKSHLESKFQPGMTWQNHGNRLGQWSIDHILPLASFNLSNLEELQKACHYTNLQPLWHIDNLKKSNKVL